MTLRNSSPDFNATNLSGIYRGVIVNNKDPLKAGRVTARVYPMFEGVADSDLPWAVQVDALGGGFTNTGGLFVPVVGAFAFFMFENADPRYPVMLGAAPCLTNGTPQVPTDSTTNYPNRRVYRSPGGTEILIDDTSGSKLLKITMANGFSLQVDNSGDVTQSVPGNLNTTVTGILTATVTGAASVSSNDSITLQAPIIHLSGPVTGTSTITAASDVLAGPNSISLVNHTHSGVTSGSGISGPPVA